MPKPRLKFRPASADELQVDLDFIRWTNMPSKERWLNEHELMLSAIDGNFTVTLSESKGGNVHVTVKLSFELPEMERIALQAALGDDPMRVVLNWRRARAGDRHPILLLEKEK